MRRLAPLAGVSWIGGHNNGVAFGRLLGDVHAGFTDQKRRGITMTRLSGSAHKSGSALRQPSYVSPSPSSSSTTTDEHDAAIENLDFAIAEFQDMKM